jgi:hypothetical protein
LRNQAYAAALLILISAGTLSAQHTNNGNSAVDPNKYWQAPGETDRDSKGNVIYTEIKDPKSFTKRVFANGEWATYHYRPNTVEISRIENSDSTENLLYDDAHNINGVTVQAAGKSHTLHYDRPKGIVTADNLPAITVERDASSAATRDFIVRSDKTIIASIDYTSSGEVASINIGAMTLSLTPAGTNMQETLKVNGTTIKEATATIAVKRTFTVFLEPVAGRLHIGNDWANDARSRATQAGFLNTVRNGNDVLVRIVRAGEAEAAFAADGTALFYDLMVNYGPGGTARQRDYKVAALYAAVLPTHIIVTSDGNVGAYVETPGSGSIRAFWTSNSGGRTQYNYSVYDSGAPRASSSLSRAAHATSSAAGESGSVKHLTPVVTPKLMMICDSTQVCTSGGDQCPSCGTCATYYYYCDTGGGGYSPPAGDGSGGGGPTGGSQAPGNHILDGNLHITVNRAIVAAENKLTDVQCGVALMMNARWDNTSALDQLTLRGGGESAKDWFASISWRDGAGIMNPATGREKCESACAFTTPGDTTDYVCSSFIQRAFQANTLIHEMLHTLGMPECNGISCPNSSYMTPADIDTLVAQYCGAN